MKIKWLDIDNTNGLYQISNKGDVRSYNHQLRNKKYIILKSQSKKYYRVGIILNNGIKKSIHVSKLVYETFNKTKITTNFNIVHIDGNKFNCEINNLKLITRRDFSVIDKFNKNGYLGLKKESDYYTVQVNFCQKEIKLFKGYEKKICNAIYQSFKKNIRIYEKEKMEIISKHKQKNILMRVKEKL